MNYKLEFKDSALKEWGKLDNSIKSLFKRRLAERLVAPRVESARLAGMPDCYKIKLRDAGYRLVYQVIDARVVVVVIAVASGKMTSSTVWPRRGCHNRSTEPYSGEAGTG